MPPRRRQLLALLLGLLPGLLLGACAADRPEPPTRLLAEARLPGPEHDALEVTVYDVPPGSVVEEVSLIGPEGQRLSGTEIRRVTTESGPGVAAGPSIGVGVSGGSSSGINPFFGLGWSIFGGGPSRQSLQITYLVVLPPELSYPEDPQAWRVEVRYRDVTGAQQLRTIPAPAPE